MAATPYQIMRVGSFLQRPVATLKRSAKVSTFFPHSQGTLGTTMVGRHSCWPQETDTLTLCNSYFKMGNCNKNNRKNAVCRKRNFMADALAINKTGQTSLDIASFWNHTATADTIRKFLQPPPTGRLEFVHHYSASVVNRQSYQRSNVEYINEVKVSDKSRFLVFGELEVLTTQKDRGDTKLALFTWEEVKEVVNNHKNTLIFLGIGDIEKGKLLRESHHAPSDDDIPYFAINFTTKLTEEEFPTKATSSHGDLQYVSRGMMLLRKEDSGLAAQARSILAWNNSNKFCASCGGPTKSGDSGYKRICATETCKTNRGTVNVSYPRTDPVIIMAIISKCGGKILLGRGKRHPPRTWSCIAGFVEPGESIEDAARREALEECGVKVGPITYHSSQAWPFPASLMIGLTGTAVSDDIHVDKNELEDAKWFDKAVVAEAIVEGYDRPEGIKIPPPFAIAHQLIKSWLQISPNL